MNKTTRIWQYSTLALLSAATLWPQAAQGPTDGYTPAAIAAGLPNGITGLSPHEAVDLFSGNLAFEVPLYEVGGRANAGYPIVLPIGTKWNIKNTPNNNQNVFTTIASVYPYDMIWPDGAGVSRYTPGEVHRRDMVNPDSSSGTFSGCMSGTMGFGYSYYEATTLTKVTWVEANGTEHEFLDTQNAGAPLPTAGANYNCATDPIYGGPDRGRTFEATDGSGATFVADNDIHDDITVETKRQNGEAGIPGWLFLKDGTRYYADGAGEISLIIDRVGSQTTINGTANGLLITDSLGRQVTITYGNVPSETSVSDTISYPGVGGEPRMITVTYDTLSNHLISGQPATYGDLFPALPLANNYLDGTFNPPVVSKLLLPDGVSSYTFLYNQYGELAQVNLPSGGVYQYDYPSTMPTSGCSGGACLLSYSQDDPTGGTQERESALWGCL